MRTERLCATLLVVVLCGILPQAHAEPKKQAESKPLTLEEAVTVTLQQNPELRAMQKDVDAANAKISQARSWDDPMVGVRFYQVPFNGSFDDAMDIDYIVAQKFPFPGKKKAASQIAYHEYLHHIELLGERGRQMLRDVKTAYYGLFSVRRMLEASRQSEGVLRRMVETAQAKLSANQAPAIDAIQGQAEIAKILAERQALVEREKGLESRLRTLMARPEDPASEESIRLPPQLEPPRWDTKLEELVETAQLRHPSVKLAEHNVSQKEWGVKGAKRDYLPDLNAQVEYVQRPGPTENAWTGEFLLNVPLIVKKKMKAVEQAQAELAGARYSYSAAKNEVADRVREAYAKMKSADRMRSVYGGTLLPQIRQALETASMAYGAGKSDFLVVLNSARGLSDAQLDYWKAFEAYAGAVYELEEAVGITREEWLEMKKAPETLPETQPKKE
jgi:outer membrane protein, heavy metal efflux system